MNSPTMTTTQRSTDGTTMQAITQDRYGEAADVLRLEEIARPAIGEEEVLLRVHAAGVDRGVWHLMTGLPYPDPMVVRTARFDGEPARTESAAAVLRLSAGSTFSLRLFRWNPCEESGLSRRDLASYRYLFVRVPALVSLHHSRSRCPP